jgi:DNA-3-methyladenine glycosylase II
LVRRPNEEIIEALTSIHGIGRWTAEMFLIFSLNRPDILPVDDLGIRKAIQRWYGYKTLPSARTIRRIGRPWHPYETIASWYLWRSLRLA